MSLSGHPPAQHDSTLATAWSMKEPVAVTAIRYPKPLHSLARPLQNNGEDAWAVDYGLWDGHHDSLMDAKHDEQSQPWGKSATLGSLSKPSPDPVLHLHRPKFLAPPPLREHHMVVRGYPHSIQALLLARPIGRRLNSGHALGTYKHTNLGPHRIERYE